MAGGPRLWWSGVRWYESAAGQLGAAALAGNFQLRPGSLGIICLSSVGRLTRERGEDERFRTRYRRRPALAESTPSPWPRTHIRWASQCRYERFGSEFCSIRSTSWIEFSNLPST